MEKKKKTVTPEEIEKNTVEAVDSIDTEHAKFAAKNVDNTESAEVAEIGDDAEGGNDPDEVEAEEFDDAEGGNDLDEVETEEYDDADDETEDDFIDDGEDEFEDAEQTDEVDEASDVSDEATDTDVTEGEENSTSLPEFMNIEHFADYRSKAEEPVEKIEEEAQETDGDAEDGEVAEASEAEESLDGDEVEYTDKPESGEAEELREYENMTILDEIEDEDDTEDGEGASGDDETYDEKKPRKVDARFDLVEMFVCMLAVIMLLSAFVFRHSVVDGGSMENTLFHGEHLIITNFFYEPKQYDIIVCEDYTTALQKPIVKRIIATEGQTVRVVSMDEVYVDGKLVDTSFVNIDGEERLEFEKLYPIECVVPEGEVFVMGDHRNSSVDSRAIGTIDEDAILGKVILRFYPFDRFGKVE